MKLTKKKLRNLVEQEISTLLNENMMGSMGYSMGVKSSHPAHDICKKLIQMFPDASDEELAFAFVLGSNPEKGIGSAMNAAGGNRTSVDGRCAGILLHATRIYMKYHGIEDPEPQKEMPQFARPPEGISADRPGSSTYPGHPLSKI